MSTGNNTIRHHIMYHFTKTPGLKETKRLHQTSLLTVHRMAPTEANFLETQ